MAGFREHTDDWLGAKDITVHSELPNGLTCYQTFKTLVMALVSLPKVIFEKYNN
jgi:hypothetical protein